jgi:hypothetical protein
MRSLPLGSLTGLFRLTRVPLVLTAFLKVSSYFIRLLLALMLGFL